MAEAKIAPEPPSTCNGCWAPLSPGDARSIPAFARLPAAFAAAFLHGGLWAMRELSLPYCARCRNRLVAAAVGLTAVGLSAAACGIWAWIALVRWARRP
ncbi:MAG: hypothetical protein HY078_08250 [Elusimicrobia bacterium]|nr:hypothetical protein [Elusimicrobiota bacterium]